MKNEIEKDDLQAVKDAAKLKDKNGEDWDPILTENEKKLIDRATNKLGIEAAQDKIFADRIRKIEERYTEAVEARCIDLIEKIEEKSKEIENLLSKLKVTDGELVENKKTVVELLQDKSNLRKDVDQKKEQIIQLETDKKKLEEEKSQAEKELRENTKKDGEKIEQLQKEAIDKLNKIHTATISDLNTKYEKIIEELKKSHLNELNDEQKAHQKTKESLKNNSQEILTAITEINGYFLSRKNYLIDKNGENKARILGTDWEKSFANKSSEEIEEQKNALIKLIDDEREKQEVAFEDNKNQIQTKMDEVRDFLANPRPLKEQLEELLSKKLSEKLKIFQNEWAASEDPVKYHAFLNKNKNSDSERVIRELIQSLETRALSEEAIQVIEQALGKYKLKGSDLGNDYRNFAITLRKMKDERKINEYENRAIGLTYSIGPLLFELDNLIKSGKEMLDGSKNSQVIQENRKNVLDFVFRLEDYTKSTKDNNEARWLAYISRQTQTDEVLGGVLRMAREQSKKRLINITESLKSGKLEASPLELKKYEDFIERASSKELRSREYEIEFIRAHQVLQQAQIIQEKIS